MGLRYYGTKHRICLRELDVCISVAEDKQKCAVQITQTLNLVASPAQPTTKRAHVYRLLHPFGRMRICVRCHIPFRGFFDVHYFLHLAQPWTVDSMPT
jgi:hypothetical protein